MISYVVFFGSVQIFKYLLMNGVELDVNLWFYVVHCRNQEMFHLIEEHIKEPPTYKYVTFIGESIKCHHNNYSFYMMDNYVEYDIAPTIYLCFRYYNFELFPSDLDNTYIFLKLCKYSYYDLVKFLINSEKIVIDETIIEI